MSDKRRLRRITRGVVDHRPKDKTVSVKTVRLVQHRKYHRYVRRLTVYKVHDEREQARPGDVVEIAETRPLSKTKHWRLVRIVSRRGEQGSEVQA